MKRLPLLIFSLLIIFPLAGSAATDPLSGIYQKRSDLQSVFDPKTGLAISSKAGFLIDLTDWARQYGWQEYPSELSAYAPETLPPKATGGETPPLLTSRDYIVVDQTSGQILAAEGAEEVWPIASLTKLMTAQMALIRGIDVEATTEVKTVDDVGGAKLYVSDGTTFSLDDLLSAMLIGSANNAANAIARTVGADFVALMNEKAAALHLNHTRFVDASGIDPQNVSTAREVAILAEEAFAFDIIRKKTTTVRQTIVAVSAGSEHQMRTTNWMLYYPEYDDVYVTSGKTGYLEESGWNLVERLRPSATQSNKELLIVLFGAASRADSFRDAEALAQWVWETFDYAL